MRKTSRGDQIGMYTDGLRIERSEADGTAIDRDAADGIVEHKGLPTEDGSLRWLGQLL